MASRTSVKVFRKDNFFFKTIAKDLYSKNYMQEVIPKSALVFHMIFSSETGICSKYQVFLRITGKTSNIRVYLLAGSQPIDLFQMCSAHSII